MCEATFATALVKIASVQIAAIRQNESRSEKTPLVRIVGIAMKPVRDCPDSGIAFSDRT